MQNEINRFVDEMDESEQAPIKSEIIIKSNDVQFIQSDNVQNGIVQVKMTKE